jgi:hypothetical protein
LNKKIAANIFLCFLGIALLSNRFLLLRQPHFTIHQNASFHLPIDNAERPREGRRTLLIALTSEGAADLHEPARDAAEIERDSENTLHGSRFLHELHIPLSLRPPAYILQSALIL